MSTVNERIEEIITDNEVVLFMKGTRMFPQCGFSAKAVEIFKRCGVKVKGVNVLKDPEIRQGIKDFSNWPTIPQAYVKGKFVGGSDIILEMFENGELQGLLGVEPEAEPTAPKLTVTPAAAAQFKQALAEDGDDVLRFDVSPSFQYDLFFGEKDASDFAVDCGGITVYVVKAAANRANGTTIDFITKPQAGFKIDNPNEPASVKNITAKQLKEKLGEEGDVHLFDVRPEGERLVAKIDAAKPFSPAAVADLDKAAFIVMQCHHGIRSRNAAETLLAEGFRNVHNLTGGIDAWSVDVDSDIKRY